MANTIGKGYGNDKVDAVVASELTAQFTRRDWLDLALAALDQGGERSAEYTRLYDALSAYAADVEP